MPEVTDNRNGNGWREPKFLLACVIVIVSVVLTFSGLSATVEYQTKRAHTELTGLQRQIDNKVEQVEHNECMKRLDKSCDELKENINEVKASQRRIEDKVDEILLK